MTRMNEWTGSFILFCLELNTVVASKSWRWAGPIKAQLKRWPPLKDPELTRSIGWIKSTTYLPQIDHFNISASIEWVVYQEEEEEFL